MFGFNQFILATLLIAALASTSALEVHSTTQSASQLVSQGKPTSQSSEGWSGRPSRAVDGNTAQSYGSSSCTHTSSSGHPWWKVDLRQTYSVDKVIIWNRSDCCQTRLNNVDVKVDRQVCGRIGRATSVNTISCGFKSGRTIIVQQTKSDYLTLCEVRVYARAGAVPATPTGRTWAKLLSNGAYGNYDVGAAKFNDVFKKSGDFVIKRVCSNCRSDYKEVYYRRYTSPTAFAPYDYMKMNWFSRNNVLNRDFGIFSSYADAMAKRNPWKFCNYNDPGVGFPRDCGKTGYVAHQWNAFSGSRHAGGSRSVAYYIHGSGSATTVQHRNSFSVRNNRITHFASWCASGGAKIVSGDFNGDGKGDVACTGVAGWRTIPTAFGNGHGSYHVTNHVVSHFPQWMTTAGVQMVAGDFDGDGKTDILGMGPRGWATSPVARSLGNGQYHVTNHGIHHMASWATTSGAKLLAADFNGDGKCDIALAGGHGWGSVPVAFSRGNMAFNTVNHGISHFASWCASSGAKIVAGDFNGDRKADVACAGVKGWATIPTAFGKGNGQFSVTNHGVSHFPQWATTSGVQMVAADFNGDGKCDILLDGPRGWATAPIAYSRGNGQYTVTNNPIAHIAGWASTPGVKLLAGQFGGDKRADIALAGGHGWATLPTALAV